MYGVGGIFWCSILVSNWAGLSKKFLKIFDHFWKIITNVTSPKLRAFEQSHLDAKTATSSFCELPQSIQLQAWEFQIFLNF